jgi:hypothetical protein
VPVDDVVEKAVGVGSPNVLIYVDVYPVLLNLLDNSPLAVELHGLVPVTRRLHHLHVGVLAVKPLIEVEVLGLLLKLHPLGASLAAL